MAEHLTSTKARVAAHKGHLSRDIAAVKRAVVFLDNNPSAAARKQVNDIFDKISTRKDNIASLYEDLIELEPAKTNDYNVKLDEVEAAFDTAMTLALAAMHKFDTTTAHAQQGAPQGQGRTNQGAEMKVQTALKPDKLSRDNTPAELISWIRKFRAFYSMSKLNQVDIMDQQAFVLQNVDLELETFLRQNITDTTPIFGDGGCMEMLEERFKRTYPIFTRRLEWFKYMQQPGQSCTEYYTQLRQRGDVAEMAELDLDAQYVFKIICGVIDDKLREKFLKLHEPTLEEIVRTMEAHDITQKSISSLSKSKSASTVATMTDVNYIRMEDVKGRCFGCGKDRHANRDECPARGRICNKCKRRNHFADMCFGPGWKSRPRQDRSKSPGARHNRGRSPTPGSSRSSSPSSRASAIKVMCNQAKTEFNKPTPLISITVQAQEDRRSQQWQKRYLIRVHLAQYSHSTG